jgi:hypothetical protein
VIPALEAVAEGGLTAEARQFAEAALLALSEKELHIDAEGQKHVMLSCECEGLLVQTVDSVTVWLMGGLMALRVQINGMCRYSELPRYMQRE